MPPDAMTTTLRQSRIFEAVARGGAWWRDLARGHRLRLTQPAVSMQIKQLRGQIGLALLEQLGKRMFLTEAGEEMRGHARDIGPRIVNLSAAMDPLRGLQRGRRRLAVVAAANDFRPSLIADFNRRHPGVRVRLRVANREFVLSALADNSTDLAITGQPPQRLDVVARHFWQVFPTSGSGPSGTARTSGCGLRRARCWTCCSGSTRRPRRSAPDRAGTRCAKARREAKCETGPLKAVWQPCRD